MCHDLRKFSANVFLSKLLKINLTLKFNLESFLKIFEVLRERENRYGYFQKKLKNFSALQTYFEECIILCAVL